MRRWVCSLLLSALLAGACSSDATPQDVAFGAVPLASTAAFLGPDDSTDLPLGFAYFVGTSSAAPATGYDELAAVVGDATIVAWMAIGFEDGVFSTLSARSGFSGVITGWTAPDCGDDCVDPSVGQCDTGESVAQATVEQCVADVLGAAVPLSDFDLTQDRPTFVPPNGRVLQEQELETPSGFSFEASTIATDAEFAVARTAEGTLLWAMQTTPSGTEFVVAAALLQ